MWTTEHSIESDADAATIFAMFSDVSTWHEWNSGVIGVELEGPFQTGTAGTQVMPGDERLAFKLSWVEQGKGFEDETPIPDANVVVRVRHTVEPIGDKRTRITYRCVIDGPAADVVGPEIGPGITSDFPDVLAKLSAHAQARTRR